MVSTLRTCDETGSRRAEYFYFSVFKTVSPCHIFSKSLQLLTRAKWLIQMNNLSEEFCFVFSLQIVLK